MVRDEELKCKRFEAGLNLSIRSFVVVQAHTSYRKVVDVALLTEREKCVTSQITERNKQMRAGRADITSAA